MLDGPWGRQAVNALGDGYRATIQWVLDFLGWAVHAGALDEDGRPCGILIIDELEQHLHPRRQRHIVSSLRNHFPKVQIIATTHTPLIAAAAAEEGQIFRLQGEGDQITIEELDNAELLTKRAGQVLTSRAFGLNTTRSPGTETKTERFAALLGKEKRDEGEERELEQLRTELKATYALGESEYERRAEAILNKLLDEIDKIDDETPRELLDIETRRQLQELLD